MTREEFLIKMPELAANYEPSPEVLRKIGNVTLCIIVGPTGVGKSSIIDRSGFKFVPSNTTRSQRPGERDGVDMIFEKDIDQAVANIKAARYVQIATGASGDLYATIDTSYPDSGVAILPVMADVVPVFRRLGFKDTKTIFIAAPTSKEWMRRIKKPGLTEHDIQKRMPEAHRSLNFALQDPDTHFVLNDDLNTAVEDVRAV